MQTWKLLNGNFFWGEDLIRLESSAPMKCSKISSRLNNCLASKAYQGLQKVNIKTAQLLALQFTYVKTCYFFTYIHINENKKNTSDNASRGKTDSSPDSTTYNEVVFPHTCTVVVPNSIYCL